MTENAAVQGDLKLWRRLSVCDPAISDSATAESATAAPGPLIELSGIGKTYPGTEAPALRDISLSIHRGEILVLLAPSGSGKTTLLRLISGFETPDTGTVRIDGRNMRRIPPARRGVGVVFQEGSLFPHLTIEENVAFGLHLLPRPERREKTREMMALIGITAWAGRYPHALSGGQQQRVALARALAPGPKIVLFDEPFSHLDHNLRAEMRDEVAALLRRLGSTAVFVTHDHEEAFAVADKIAVLNEGRLEQHDTPDVIYHLPATPFVAQFVGPADFIPAVAGRGEVRCEIGTFTGDHPFPEGVPVQMMIRPDDIDFIPQPQGAAVVIERQFKGSENLYTLALPSGHPLHSSQHSLAVYPVGTRVNLKLNITHQVLFPA